MYRSGSLWLPTHYSLSLVGQTMGGRGAELGNGHMLACALLVYQMHLKYETHSTKHYEYDVNEE